MTIRSYPAPAQLATPTDLRPDEARAVVAALNPLVADGFALYLKTKNFHWHLSGSHFRDYHLLFDEQADALLDTTDVLAERVRRIGGTTIRSIGHIAQLQRVKDNDDDFVAPGAMVQQLLTESTTYTKNLRAAHEVCVSNRDVATASILEIYIDGADRRTWFLFEIVQGGENTR